MAVDERLIVQASFLVRFFLVSLIGAFFLQSCRKKDPSVTWTMLGSPAARQQEDAHLLIFPDGGVVLIDVGRDKATEAQLQRRGISSVDTVVITHAHKDHYGGLIPLFDSSIKIGRIILNPPPRGICQREASWGCDYQHLMNTVARARKMAIPISQAVPGNIVESRGGATLEVIMAHDGLSRPVGGTDINDTSIVLKLLYGKTRVLFTGDLNRQVGDYLVRKNFDLKADILKVPHHGGESTVSNVFLDTVSPSFAMVPAPVGLWLGDTGKRLREYFQAKGIKAYVTGLHGNVTVVILSSSYHVQTAPVGLVE